MSHWPGPIDLEGYAPPIGGPAPVRPDLVGEACSNARLLSRVCELLEGLPRTLLERNRQEYIQEVRRCGDLPIDYDPDVHGWPWEV